MDFYIGQIVYHRDIYEHREPLEIVGIRKDELELEGDYSGMYNIKQRSWMPIKGVSTVYNYAYKQKCRDTAVAIEELVKPVDRNGVTMTSTMFDLLDMVFKLTTDVSYNPEC